MKYKIRAKILEITNLAILCEEIDFHVFTRFAGHVNLFETRLYDGKWESDKDFIDINFYLTDSDALYQCDDIISRLTKIIENNNKGC